MKKPQKKHKKSIHKFIKELIRKDFKEQGGYDGRFSEKVVPNKKKKYNRSKEKKIEQEQ